MKITRECKCGKQIKQKRTRKGIVFSGMCRKCFRKELKENKAYRKAIIEEEKKKVEQWRNEK